MTDSSDRDVQQTAAEDPRAERTSAQQAQLALLLEAASAPKPGNVSPRREYRDLRFEQFLAGAVGTGPGFERAAAGDPLGAAFERAIVGMSAQRGGNTQFGAVLLLVPLVAAAGQGPLTRDAASAVVAETTVEDAVGFYRAFDHVDVAVDDPPEGMEALDVRRGSDAGPTVRERELTLQDVMARSASRDGIAAEWSEGFPRTFEAGGAIARQSGPVTDRAAAVSLALLSRDLDTFVQTRHDRETAERVRADARRVLAGEASVERFADDLVAKGINPGTTADIVAGGLFVALAGGLEV